MASEQDVTSDSLDTSVVDVPKELLGYVKSSIVDYVNYAKDFSAKIHYAEGQSPKLVVSFGTNQGQQQQTTVNDLKETNTIIVKNVPASVDEELLEIFFESTKKQGGGPVKSVKILNDKQLAFVEFCEQTAVETVMKKRPIMFGKTKLDIQPHRPLLQGLEKINNIDLKGLPAPDEFTDDLLKNHLECILPELVMIKVGSRVVRGKDWKDTYGDQDSRGIGTVKNVFTDGSALVLWDNGSQLGYSIGHGGNYEIKLAD